ncbi:MAG: hypothetical protein QXY73_01975 [Candidatus Bathyarchaeia archaeon]
MVIKVLKKMLVASALLMTLLISSTITQTQAFKGLTEEEKAKRILEIANKAYERITAHVNNIAGNETIMNLLEGLGLKGYFIGNSSNLEEAGNLLRIAQQSLNSGDYEEAISKVLEAMGIMRNVFINIHKILKQAGVIKAPEKPELQAQGILVAINRSLERIKRLNETINTLISQLKISEGDAEEIEGLLNQAKNLLNRGRELLEEGNVTGAAHKLGEANRLITQAHVTLKAKIAEARMTERLEGFRLKIEEHLNRTLEKLNETAIGRILGPLGFKHKWEFKHQIMGLIENATYAWKFNNKLRFRNSLEELRGKIKNFMSTYTVKELPSSTQSENLNLKLEVAKEVKRNQATIHVKATNTGDATLIFPNGALGIVIERNINGQWRPYYTPISIQMLIKLNPEESRAIFIKLINPPEGLYRAVAHAQSEQTLTSITATVEFTIP